jgi:hypothetical protein
MWGRHALRVTGRPMSPPHSAEARGDLRVNFFSRRCSSRAIRLWRTSGPEARFLAEQEIAEVKVNRHDKKIDFWGKLFNIYQR